VYLPFDQEGRKVYATYFGVGAILILFGWLFWRKRTRKSKE
jgi:LPXTG-motif cell wall-anchored protein